MIGYWNDEEDAALQGLSLEAQIIYLRGIRRFADKNGVAGVGRLINRASLSEVCHVIPRRGSHKAESRPTWDAVRRRLQELEDAGLIIQQQNLVFELPLATQDKSVQMRMTRGRHDDDTVSATPAKQLRPNCSKGVDDTMMTRVIMTDDDTTSPITAFTTTTTAREAETGHRRAFAMTLDWKPSDLINRRLEMQGIAPALLTSVMLAAFVNHYEANGITNNQGQWENLLVRWIKTERGSPQAAASPERHARPSSPQQPINAITDPNAYILPLLKPHKEKDIPLEERQRQLAELRRMRGNQV